MNTNQTTEQTNNQLVPFTFENHAIRMVMIDDAPWFIAKDVCDVLEIVNVSDALRGFPSNERHTLANTEGHSEQRGGAQSFNVVNEPGLYRLIFQSRKPEAEKFKTWVFNEVLPQIRKAGTFGAEGSREAESLALMSRIIDLFSWGGAFGLQQIYHMVDLSFAKSGLTGEYLSASDVARAMVGTAKTKGWSEHTLSLKVAEIRQLVAEAGIMPPLYAANNGRYKIGADAEERASFPLELPERKAEATLPFEEAGNV
jgi:prophage antirepressor-like protein